LLEKFRSLSYTRHNLEELDAEVRAEVAKHGGNPLLEEILNDQMSWKKTHSSENIVFFIF
jgi:geranylgeranyl diphosphate synthase type 3